VLVTRTVFALQDCFAIKFFDSLGGSRGRSIERPLGRRSLATVTVLVVLVLVIGSVTVGKMVLNANKVRNLVDDLSDDDISAESRLAAARALGDMGPAAKDAVPALINALSDSDPVVQEAAAWALEAIRSGN